MLVKVYSSVKYLMIYWVVLTAAVTDVKLLSVIMQSAMFFSPPDQARGWEVQFWLECLKCL